MQLSTHQFRAVRNMLLHIDEDGIEDGNERRAFEGICLAYEAFKRRMSVTENGLAMLRRLYTEQQPHHVVN